MATELERLTSFIARQVILTPGSFENILSAGINFKDWPEWYESRKALENFSANISTHNYKYALWQSQQKNEIEKLEEVYGNIDYPSDQETIKAEYTNLLKKEKASELSVQIAKRPESVSELISDFLSYQASNVDIVSFEDAIPLMMKAHEEARALGKQQVELTNWRLLSDAIGGFNPGRLGILIADTGFGKTNLGVQMALDSSTNLPTLYFNMEMIRDDFTQRLVASMMGMKSKEFHKEWDSGRAELHAKQRNLFFTTGKDLSLMEIQAVSRSYKNKHKIEMIIVDYDQKILLSGRDEEWRELQKASTALEQIAKELKCYVLLMAQSNMDGKISGSKRATFSASNVFMFEKHEDATIVRVSKNRFGKRNAAVSVDYQPEMAVVREKENYLWTDLSKTTKKEYKKSQGKTEDQKLVLSLQKHVQGSYEI